MRATRSRLSRAAADGDAEGALEAGADAAVDAAGDGEAGAAVPQAATINTIAVQIAGKRARIKSPPPLARGRAEPTQARVHPAT